MTITSLPTRNEYTASAGQTDFNYTFKIFVGDSLRCFVTPAGDEADDTLDEVTINVTSGHGQAGGGTITIDPVGNGDLVTIVSDIDEDRTIDYQVNGDFLPSEVNNDFDRVVSLVKQLGDSVTRGLAFQESEQGATGKTLPTPEAESVLQWKTDLSGLQNFPIPDLSELTTGGDTALHYHSADRARAVHTGTQLAATISNFNATVSSNTDVAASKVVTDHITVTQAVDLDTIESDTATNNSKVTNAAHTGDVTGSGALTIAAGAVDVAMMSASGTPDNTKYYRGDNQWVTGTSANIDDTAYTRAGWDGDTADAPTKNACSDTFYNMVRYLDADTGGLDNTFVGNTGNTTNTGDFNTFGGEKAGAANIGGERCAVYGQSALSFNESGDACSAFGQGALYNNLDGNYNNAFGHFALLGNVGASRNNAFGDSSLFTMALLGEDNCAFGTEALKLANHANAAKNCAFGNYSLDALTSGFGNACGGYGSGGAITTGSQNALWGAYSGGSLTANGNCVGVGYEAIAAAVDSNITGVGFRALYATNYNNTSGLGSQCVVTGVNQVQLGNSSTTTYAYGAVQDRSDRRDKTDIKDTAIGLGFINSLRAVDFKWDYREDYKTDIPEHLADDSDEDKKAKRADWIEDNKLKRIVKDGSKKRSRYHHGFIAQEVAKVIKDSGTDFGGFQDHNKIDGEDVLSLGYTEFIAPMIKSIQELSARVVALEAN